MPGLAKAESFRARPWVKGVMQARVRMRARPPQGIEALIFASVRGRLVGLAFMASSLQRREKESERAKSVARPPTANDFAFRQ